MIYGDEETPQRTLGSVISVCECVGGCGSGLCGLVNLKNDYKI